MISNKEIHTNQTKFTMNRQRQQYLKIILITSLFWVLVDAFIILYLTDCSSYKQPCEHHQQHNNNHNQDKLAEKNVNEPHLKETDYDDELKLKNNRLHNIHKQKSKPKTYREHDPARDINESPKGDDRTNFLNKIKQWFKEDSSFEPVNPSSWPGENGHAVIIPAHLKAESEKRFKENQFNIVASDLMALNRSIPDQRSESCRNREYRTDLPTTSIIIVYHNEGNSTLLRGLVSIVRRSPIRYIKEIILVDDASEGREYLHKPLDNFVKTLPVVVRIFRNKERLGLMRSRLVGADAATGDTLTFLDAHIEATTGWLPPLLSEIKMNRFFYTHLLFIYLNLHYLIDNFT
jgi:hypothetical protein